MALSVKNVMKIEGWIHGEQEKVNEMRREVVECARLNIIDHQSYEGMMAHLEKKFDYFTKMYKAVEKYNMIYNYVPVTGVMSRQKPQAPKTLTDDEKKLITEAFKATEPYLVYKNEEEEHDETSEDDQ